MQQLLVVSTASMGKSMEKRTSRRSDREASHDGGREEDAHEQGVSTHHTQVPPDGETDVGFASSATSAAVRSRSVSCSRKPSVGGRGAGGRRSQQRCTRSSTPHALSECALGVAFHSGRAAASASRRQPGETSGDERRSGAEERGRGALPY